MQIVMLIGLPSSGKTTFYKKKLSERYKHINLDTLKKRNVEYYQMIKYIENNKDFVVDNTNLTIDERKRYINLAKKYNIKIIACYINCPCKLAILRNEERRKSGNRYVKEVAIYTHNKKFQEPTYEEGFDEIYSLDNTKDNKDADDVENNKYKYIFTKINPGEKIKYNEFLDIDYSEEILAKIRENTLRNKRGNKKKINRISVAAVAIEMCMRWSIPIDIAYKLKIKDFRVDEGFIIIPKELSKNNTERIIEVNKERYCKDEAKIHSDFEMFTGIWTRAIAKSKDSTDIPNIKIFETKKNSIWRGISRYEKKIGFDSTKRKSFYFQEKYNYNGDMKKHSNTSNEKEVRPA